MAAPFLTDLHCHLIHGVDDGPRDIVHTQAMLRLAADNGVDTVCCTSHAMPSQKPFPLDVYKAHLDEAQTWADQQGLQIRLLPGSEIFTECLTIQREVICSTKRRNTTASPASARMPSQWICPVIMSISGMMLTVITGASPGSR